MIGQPGEHMMAKNAALQALLRRTLTPLGPCVMLTVAGVEEKGF